MDDADRAQDLAELELSAALKNRNTELPEVGICHYCSEQIEKGKFCDEFCRADHEKEQDIIKGRV
mgnify:CR=1 FL=1